MHELSVATELYQACRVEIDSRGGGQLESVKIAIGELSAIEPELIAFAWEAVTADGSDRAARLEVEWRPARQTCESCGDIAERQPGSWLRLCPFCGSPLSIEGGRELDILSINFEPAGARHETCP